MNRSRFFAISLGVLLAGAVASAQSSYPYPQVLPGGAPYGTTQPIVQRLPQALPRVGMPIGTQPGSLTRQIPPSGDFPGQGITLGNVISPYPSDPLPEPTFWQNLETRWFSLFGVDNTDEERSVYVPGISRRNRERDERMRRRR